MYNNFQKHLSEELASIKEAGLYKSERLICSPQSAEITVAGKTVLNFCANNYLGLANHPALIEAAKKAATVSKWGGKEPKKLDMPLRDGDTDKEDDEVYAGCYFLNAKSTTRPGICDKHKTPIVDEDEIYSGVYAYVSVTFFGYDVSGNRGVACGLNNIMKFKDGERLGGRVSAESDFGDIDCEDDDDL